MSWTTPKTWAVGDPGTAADLNTFIRDNTAFLYGDLIWNLPALINSWVNAGAGFNPAGYRKVGNRVWLRGGIKSGATGTTIFSALPAGYRPPNFEVHPTTIASGGTGWGQVSIDTAGNITWFTGAAGGGTIMVLDGVSFSVV